MESRSRGAALLSLILLVLGSTLLPEPCDAWPRGHRLRQSRNAAPELRCPNYARDCPQNLAGDSISEINEDYQSLSSSQCSPAPTQSSYDTLPPSSAFSPPQALPPYNTQPVLSSYSSSPPAASYNSQLPSVSYTPPLPAPSYDPRLPTPPCTPPQTLTPPAETPCYNCLSSAPSSFNLLPKSQNRYEPWRRHPTKFNRSPYAQEYRPLFYPQENNNNVATNSAIEYDCECGCESKFQLDEMHDLNDDASFGGYNRRSTEGEAPRVSRHYKQAPNAEAPSPPTEMYKTYMPYVREENPNESSREYASDESERRGHERLYVVYRADTLKSEQGLEDQPISERELEAVIRKAIEIARQQRAQENALRRRANQQYHYEYRPGYVAQRPQRQGRPTPLPIKIGESPHVLHEDGDEARNPGLDQSKWVAISALPKSDILAVEDVNEERWKGKAPESKAPAIEVRRPVVVDLMGDKETPQTVTETATFVGPAEDSTSKKS